MRPHPLKHALSDGVDLGKENVLEIGSDQLKSIVQWLGTVGMDQRPTGNELG